MYLSLYVVWLNRVRQDFCKVVNGLDRAFYKDFVMCLCKVI